MQLPVGCAIPPEGHAYGRASFGGLLSDVVLLPVSVRIRAVATQMPLAIARAAALITSIRTIEGIFQAPNFVSSIQWPRA